MWALGSAGVYSRLSLQFGDCPSARPSFGTHVVDNRVVRIYVVPVMVSESGDYTGLGYEDYESVISTYAQIGIMPYFVQEQPIVCTALSQSRHDSASVRKCLRGTFTATNGKVVYVLPFRLSGCAGFAFDVGGRELAVGLNRHRKTLAHELGHALGLFDIYTNLGVERPLLGLSMKLETKTSAARFEDSVDWNGGSGTRYYTSSCQHSELVKRHLMYGVTSDMRGDITSDSIWAISYQTTFQDNIAERFAPTGVCEMQIGENDLVDL